MSRCPNCRRPVDSGDKVCDFCEEPLDRGGSPGGTEQSQRDNQSAEDTRDARGGGHGHQPSDSQQGQPSQGRQSQTQPSRRQPQGQPQNTSDGRISRRTLMVGGASALVAAGGAWALFGGGDSDDDDNEIPAWDDLETPPGEVIASETLVEDPFRVVILTSGEGEVHVQMRGESPDTDNPEYFLSTPREDNLTPDTPHGGIVEASWSALDINNVIIRGDPSRDLRYRITIDGPVPRRQEWNESRISTDKFNDIDMLGFEDLTDIIWYENFHEEPNQRIFNQAELLLLEPAVDIRQVGFRALRGESGLFLGSGYLHMFLYDSIGEAETVVQNYRFGDHDEIEIREMAPRVLLPAYGHESYIRTRVRAGQNPTRIIVVRIANLIIHLRVAISTDGRVRENIMPNSITAIDEQINRLNL